MTLSIERANPRPAMIQGQVFNLFESIIITPPPPPPFLLLSLQAQLGTPKATSFSLRILSPSKKNSVRLSTSTAPPTEKKGQIRGFYSYSPLRLWVRSEGAGEYSKKRVGLLCSIADYFCQICIIKCVTLIISVCAWLVCLKLASLHNMRRHRSHGYDS